MSDEKKQHKLVENEKRLGDDTGFLSGLGIDVAQEEKEEAEEAAAQEAQEQAEEEQEKKEKKEKKEKQEAKKEAAKKAAKKKEVAKEEDKKSSKDTSGKKSSKDVDDLIEKKSQSEYTSGRRRSAPSRRRSTRSRRAPSRRRRTSGRGRRRGDNATVQIGATRRGARGSKQSTSESSKEKKTYKVSDSLKKKGTIKMGDSITVKEFSEKMGVPLPEVMKVLMANKILVAAQASIDFDTATLVAAEFEVTVEKESTQVSIEDILTGDLQAILDQDKEADDLTPRPPVVTIMGHVDHGKTQLLDYLRKTDIVAGEAGGITQSIGASQITHNDQEITFIDTPGHELFTSLRARGAKITNIVVIVVAADDGIKPQTVEAINHAKDAGVPIVVAITKIDLDDSRVEEIKGQLSEHGLQPEDRGGDTMVIPLSSITGQGVDDLLDALVLQYEMLELEYSPSRDAVGVVVESHKNAKQGVTTSLLIMTGTLRVGDIVVIHNTSGKVRRMMNRKGEQVDEAKGGDPVVILGISDLPEPGRVAEVVETEKEASKKIASIQEQEQILSKEAMLQNIMDKIGKGDKVQLKLILKADSYGSLEAIKQASHKVKLPDNVELKIIHDDVGSITDSDLVFAQAAGALVVGYNVTASGGLKKKAEEKGVELKEYEIIYEFIEYLEQLGAGMIELEEVEVKIGELDVLGVFYRKGKDMIIGGKVTKGKIVNGASFKVWRESYEEVDEDGEPLPFTKGKVTSLQKEQKSVDEIKKGHECGMKVKVKKKIEEGDRIEYFVTEEKPVEDKPSEKKPTEKEQAEEKKSA